MPGETTTTASSVPASSSLSSSCREILNLQESRASAYSALRSAHSAYLRSAASQSGGDYDLETYKLAVDAATRSFADASKRALAVKKRLEEEDGDDGGKKELAALVGKMQSLEERKLRFTVDHQLAMQEVREHPEDDLQVRNARGIKQALDCLSEELVDLVREVRETLRDQQEEGEN